MLGLLDGLLLATGFTGALTLVFLLRGLSRWLGHVFSLTYHFSPKGGCTRAIVQELDKAHHEILLQAYSFSCPAIAAALIAARKRGISVQVLLDRANEKETFSELGPLHEQGLDVLIDAHHAIAHNKIIIIDRRTLITGSFNFTRQAEQENAENMLIIKGYPELVRAYVQNFLLHREHCQKPGTADAHLNHSHGDAPHAAHWRAA